MKIFVYGTLKRDGGAYSLMEAAEGKFLKTVRTTKDYELFVTDGGFPGMKKRLTEVEGNGVLGEVFEVNPSKTGRMDGYEGIPYLFQRKTVELEDGDTALAYVFNHEVDPANLVTAGVWNN